MTHDPALSFWRHYAEREGALTEDDGSRLVMVLPPAMQQRFGLGETVAVTSDPGLAREEGCLLMAPGHPLLDSASGQVLEEGDGGHLWLEWPARPLPSGEQLLAAARDRVGVDHGRIDLGGVPAPRYAPILRVTAQAVFSLDDRFHEQEESWVEAIGGLPLPPGLWRQLSGLAQLQGPPGHPGLDPDLELAVEGAQRELEQRSAARLRILAGQVARIREDERVVAEDYYRAALESIEQRRLAAASDRQRLLEAQAEATRAEWARREQEIRQKFEPRCELRPVRLHLLWVPAMEVPVVIRRGERGFPFSLVWWLPAHAFAPVRCPSCGSGGTLTAARNRLGCRACLAPPPPAAVPQAQDQKPPARPSGPAVEPAAKDPPLRAPAPPPEALPRRAGQGGDRNLSRLRELAKADQQRRLRVTRTGASLGFSFWQAAVNRESWPRKRASPDSPLRVLYRLYGFEAPLRAIGMPLGAMPLESSSSTREPIPGVLHCTEGLLVTTDSGFPFSLHWRMADGRPAVDEVLPCLGQAKGRIAVDSLRPGAVAALHWGAPDPRCDLDPVAAALWSTELPRSGLPVVARCLAAWWRLPAGELPSLPAPVLAAALAALVGGRAGLARSKERAGEDYSVELGEVEATARILQSRLGLAPNRWW